MSKYPAIPEFTDDPRSVATTVRALKEAVELLTGQRQGPALGAPLVFVQEDTPSRAVRGAVFGRGDIWINTLTNKVSYWNGVEWEETT